MRFVPRRRSSLCLKVAILLPVTWFLVVLFYGYNGRSQLGTSSRDDTQQHISRDDFPKYNTNRYNANNGLNRPSLLEEAQRRMEPNMGERDWKNNAHPDRTRYHGNSQGWEEYRGRDGMHGGRMQEFDDARENHRLDKFDDQKMFNKLRGDVGDIVYNEKNYAKKFRREEEKIRYEGDRGRYNDVRMDRRKIVRGGDGGNYDDEQMPPMEMEG